MVWMRTDLGRTGARLPQGGGKGGRGSEVRLAERDGKKERDFRDETFMGLCHAAKTFPPKSHSKCFISIQTFKCAFYIVLFNYRA